jgi:hypothetical protein
VIGGHDIIFRLNPTFSIAHAAEIVGARWPEAVFEDAETAQAYERPDQLPVTALEVFVYRNPAALEQISDEGVTDGNGNDLIHLLRSLETLTVVVHTPDTEETRAILEEIRRSCEP